MQFDLIAQAFLPITHRRLIADRLVQLKLPAIAATTEYVEAGALRSYAASSQDNFRRAAAYVNKIFKGEKPGDLPIEQPSKVELIVNLKTAKAMGPDDPAVIFVTGRS